jgi:hypothetical protein
MRGGKLVVVSEEGEFVVVLRALRPNEPTE